MLYRKVKKYILNTYKECGDAKSIPHLKKTVYWIKTLKPNADEALLIAGISHDIERAYNGDWIKGSTRRSALKKHQDLSAERISEILKNFAADRKIIKRVSDFVSNHEWGGRGKKNLLKDADCISYFQTQSLRHIAKWRKEGKTKKDIKKKFDYTYKKISSTKAKKICLPMYKKALAILEDSFAS